MANIPLTVACGRYDRVQPLIDGRVSVEGCDATFLTLEPEEMFFRALRFGEFDVSELSLNSYAMMATRGVSPYIAIPVFTSRIFRHSSVFIRTDRGIERPEDLKGKTVGIPEYQQTAIVWVRGMLEDEYGVRARDMAWRSGGVEEPGRDERTPLVLRDDVAVDLAPIPEDRTLSAMLRDGEIDALITARTPSVFIDRTPDVGRLFPDYPSVERAYYEKTRLFPIMHVIGVRRALAERFPWLPGSVFKSFAEAKSIAFRDLCQRGALRVMLPWIEADVERVQGVMGPDYWHYGLEENRHDLETVIDYSWRDGLLARKPTIEELFAESTFSVSRI